MTVRELLKQDLSALGCRIEAEMLVVAAPGFLVLSVLLWAGWRVEPCPPGVAISSQVYNPASGQNYDLLYGHEWLRLKKAGQPYIGGPRSGPGSVTVNGVPYSVGPSAYTDMLMVEAPTYGRCNLCGKTFTGRGKALHAKSHRKVKGPVREALLEEEMEDEEQAQRDRRER
jgi:hypothetical protein